MPLRAVIVPDAPILDSRSAARRTLCLQVPAQASADLIEALIHNISETGLLIETAADLQVGESLQVDLPHAGTTTALVIWNRGRFIGCEFAAPISRAALSAAQLRNPFGPVPESRAARYSNPAPKHHEDAPENAEARAGRTALIFSLFLSLLMALVFVIALLSFPFSA